MTEQIPLDDTLADPSECNCDSQTYDDEDDLQSTHHKRRCAVCKNVWWSLHCPHDGFQNRCSQCGARASQIGML